MKLPEELQSAIDRLVSNLSPQILRKAREFLSQTYKQGRSSQSIFSDEAARLSYLAARFPATYGACHLVLNELRKQTPEHNFKKIIDLGSGPGTATWAAIDIFPGLESSVLLETSLSAVRLGKELAQQCSSQVEMNWIQADLEALPALPTGEIAIASYALGELDNPEKVLSHLWTQEFQILVIIEPGTPAGFNLIRKLRAKLIDLGAHLLAPCPHSLACPMQGKNWCHFSSRIERTKLHRMLKEGSLGHEDEKFSYLIASRLPPLISRASRILRHPQKGSGHVRFSLCTPEGNEEEKIVSRKDKELYKIARDSEWGESF